MDESPGGISPPGAPKTVREPLDSHGSRCSTVGKRAAGFTSSTSSSCCQLASVGRWSRLNNAAPSVQLHYRAFVPTTSHSAPVLRIGTLVLAVLAACDFSLYIGAQVLTFRTKAWLSFAPPPCRMPLGPSQASPKTRRNGHPPVLASPSSLLKNLEIGASPVFLPWGLGRSGCCEQTLTYAASSLGMRIRL